jgi:hypothetical protein
MARLGRLTYSAEQIVNRMSDPQHAARLVAARFRIARDKIEHDNRAALGVDDVFDRTWVNGTEGAPLESVKLDGGTLLTRWFFPIRELLEYAEYLLVLRSPVKTGHYQKNHRLFADGTETQLADRVNFGGVREWVYTTQVPYSRKIERGQGSAPDWPGVYEGTAQLLNQRFRNFAFIKFTYEAIVGGATQPYAAVALGTRKRNAATKTQRIARQAHVQARYPAIRIRIK